MKKEPLLIAFASQKGGVGKSAFTVLVASILHYQKGLKVGVVDCDSPQHSISRMRDRDIESVQESDFLKVVLYRQHEQIRKRSYPVIKSNPEKAIEDLYRYIEDRIFTRQCRKCGRSINDCQKIGRASCRERVCLYV